MLDLDEESLSDRMQAGRNSVVFGLPCKKLQFLYRMQSVFFFYGVIYFWGVTVYLEAFLVVSVCCKHTCGLRRSLCYKKVMCILNPKSKSYCDQ